MCSALICGTVLGDIFETGHNHKSKNILRLQPEEPPGDSSYGSHIGHAHAENRVDSDGMQGQGVSNDHAEDRGGDEWQDLGGHHHHAEERGGDEGQDHHHGEEKLHAGFDHDEQRVDGQTHHEEGKFHRGIVEEDPENSHEQKRSKYFRKPEVHQSLRQKDNHKEKKKHNHEHEEENYGHHHEKDERDDEHMGENKEQVMLEFVALESSLGGIHRCIPILLLTTYTHKKTLRTLSQQCLWFLMRGQYYMNT